MFRMQIYKKKRYGQQIDRIISKYFIRSPLNDESRGKGLLLPVQVETDT